MKRLLLLIFAAGLIGCAEQPPAPAVTTGYPYSRYSTTAEAWGYRSARYANWSTPEYIYHGQALPQQDEIKTIEVELNWRYQSGDKTAELIPFWPESRRHIS
jgi:hypothetical protein